MEIKKVAKDLSYSFIFLAAANILGYLVRIIFARNLSVQDFGLFYAVLNMFAFFAAFRTLGTTQSLIHFMPKYVRESKEKQKYALSLVFRLQAIIGLAISAVFFIFSNQIAADFFHIPQASILIKIQAVTYFVIGFAETLYSSFRSYQKPAIAVLYDPVRLAFVTIVSLIMVKLNIFGISNLMILWLLGYVVITLLYLVLFYKNYKDVLYSPFKKYSSIFREIKSYSIPLMVGVGAQIILSNAIDLILTYFRGPSDVAFYEIALSSSNLISILLAPLSFLIFPMVSHLFFNKQKKLIKEGLQVLYNTGLFLIAPIFVLLLIYPELIIKTLFSDKYLFAANALKLLTAGAFFWVFGQINFDVLSGIGEVKIKTKLIYAIAFVNLILGIILIPLMGYMGATIVNSVCAILLSLFSYLIIARKIKSFGINFKAMLKIIVLLLIFMGLVIFLKNVIITNLILEAVIVSAISLASYLVLGLFVFRVINIKLIKELSKGVFK